MVSIIIPAHNEEQVIGRCLQIILRDAQPGEFDVVVVTNGCTDRTAEIAASFGPDVRVVDSPVASKPAALNLGDRTARSFPRLYVDADIEVDTAAIRAVARALEQGAVLAAPRLRLDLTGRPWTVRAWYDVWLRLPYAQDNLVGAGFYGLSETARRRFDEFPDTMAEDVFIAGLAPSRERQVVADHEFVVHPPYTLRSLVAIQTRMAAATARDRHLFSHFSDEVRRGHVRELGRLALRPALLPKVAWYGVVTVMVKLGARRRNRRGDTRTWTRDVTARGARVPDGGTA